MRDFAGHDQITSNKPSPAIVPLQLCTEPIEARSNTVPKIPGEVGTGSHKNGNQGKQKKRIYKINFF
jgi:hypothetical protein